MLNVVSALKSISRASIAEQILQLLARGGYAFVGFRFWNPIARREIKILAKVSRVLFQNRFGAPLAALMCGVAVVKRAVQAHTQISAAFHADFAPAGLAIQSPRFSAFMAMTVHISAFRVQCWKSDRFLQL
jgi:hypothetical protein